MKKILLFLALIIMNQFFLSCSSAQKNRRSPVTDQRNITVVEENTKICIQPPPQFYKSDISTKIDAKIPYIKETLNAGFSIDQTIEKLRAELPDTYNFETVEYRLCVALQQGNLSKEDYSKFLSEILPKLYKHPEYVRFNVKVKTKENNKEVSVPGALVTIKGTTIGAITDSDGNGLLLIPYEMVGNVTITINMVGYITSENNAYITKEYTQEFKILVPYIE